MASYLARTFMLYLSVCALALALAGCGSRSTSSLAPTPLVEQSPQTPTKAPKPPRAAEPFALETENLHDYRKKEIASLSNPEVEALNEKQIVSFTKYQPEIRKSDKTGGEVSRLTGNRILHSIFDNPIVSPSYDGKYQHEGVSIGYCFGRATYVHLALKKLALQTSSIRKVWLVGPMNNGAGNWGFHVATAAFVKGEGWIVIDSNLHRLATVREWYDYYRWMSKDDRLRIYVTMPNRFGAKIADYNPVDMGLDASIEKDWYHHYFVDLMAWFRKADFPSMGFERVEPALESRPAVF